MAMAMSLDRKVFHETEGVIVRGEYSTPNGPRKLLASRGVLEDADYYAADDVAELIEDAGTRLAQSLAGPCRVFVCDEDMLVAALDVQAKCASDVDGERAGVLVLNFANAFQAGGNINIGAHAQEGELCRRTTLFASISSKEARPFYDANFDLGGNVYTNGLLVSPHVEVFREVGYLTMETPVVIAVMSSPAPYARGLESMAEGELLDVLETRILGMFAVAAQAGYKHFVLGAWGCDSNGNDPAMMARAFREALDTPLASGTYADLFESVTFAIPDDADGSKNRQAFQAQFGA